MPCSESGRWPREYEVHSNLGSSIQPDPRPLRGGVFRESPTCRHGSTSLCDNIGTWGAPGAPGEIVFDMVFSDSDPYTPATMVSTGKKPRVAGWQISLKLMVPVLCVACLSGCVRRRMTIRTNPPGAVVYVDDYQIGTTPVATNFVHYGTRKIRIVKDGYETLTVEQPIPAPWYQVPPIDFVAETMVPKEIRDHRTLNYQLVPQRVVPPDELRARAEDLRARAATPGIVPASANVFQPAPGTGYGAPSYAPPGEPVPSPPLSGYGYPPSLAPGSQPVMPPPTTLPPSIAPQVPPGGQTLPRGGIPIR